MFAGLRKKWRDQIGQTKTILGEKVREALASVVPITLIVLILCFTAAPVPTDVLLAFLVGAVLLIVGMGLFTLGADTAMLPIGERVGAQMTKSRKLWVVVCVSLLIGIIVTISEPDLQVLAYSSNWYILHADKADCHDYCHHSDNLAFCSHCHGSFLNKTVQMFLI